MSVLVDDVVVSPKEAVPDGVEASLSAAGLTIVGASFGESVKKGSLVQTSAGVVMVDRDPEPRTVELKLEVRGDADVTLPEAASYLERIVGELQERDNWIRRDFHVGGDFDSILYHVSGEVSLNDFAGWQVGACPDVTLTMVCDFAAYATEETESAKFSTTTARELIYTLPPSDGTTKGLKRVQVTNDNLTGDLRGLIWAEECVDYKPGDATALPAYPAVALTPKGGAVVTAGPGAEVRAVGTVAAGTGAISPGKPAGTLEGDLLIMVAESGGATASTEANAALTASGWTSPPAPYADQKKGNTRLTVLYRIATGTDPTTTNDTGDHQIARIIAIKAGTFDLEAPFNVAAVGTQGATKSVSIPGATTTRDNCLVIACASGHLPDATTTAEFGAPTNASLSGLTERIDNTTSEGDGGALYVASGLKAAKGAYSATTCTAVTEAERGVISLAINPPAYVQHSELTAGWLTILGSEIAGAGHMTHKGPRRMWMRIFDPGATAGEVQLRLLWRTLGASRWTESNALVRTYVVGSYSLVDLGECRPQLAALGNERWEWKLMARVPSGTAAIRISDVYPLPQEQFLLLREPFVPVVADAQSIKAPGAVADSALGGGSSTWTSPENAKVADLTVAKLPAMSGSVESHGLLTSSHGFAIPSEAVITGIKLEYFPYFGIEPQVNGPGPGRTQLVKAGALVGENKGAPYESLGYNWTTQVWVFGGSDDLWGTTWTPAQVNASTFGAYVAARHAANQANSPANIGIDWITVTVYYTEARPEDRVCYGGRSLEIRSEVVARQHQTDDVWGTLIPDGFLPYDAPGGMEERPSRGILIPTQGDLGMLPDTGVTKLSATVVTREGHHLAREAS